MPRINRMVTPQTRHFNARLEPFSAVREFIERICAGAGVPHGTSEDLILIVDELSANTVRHGYPSAEGDAGEWPIWVTLSVSGQEVAVLYEDAAPAHDPFENIAPPDYSGPPESWRIGGWGVPLVVRIAGNPRYERSGGRNRIHLTVPFNSRPGG